MKVLNDYLSVVMKILLLLGFLGLFSCVAKKDIKSKKSISILALGDSYTIGESVSEDLRWPVQLRNALTKDGREISELKIIAKTGWRTDDLYKATESESLQSKYDIVTLLIGVNDQYQGVDKVKYPSAFTKNLEQAKRHLKTDGRLIVVSIPDYAYTPYGQTVDHKRISSEIDHYNNVNKAIALEAGASYVYITDLTRQGLEDKDLVAEDGLHPSGKCYTLFVPKLMDVIND